MNLLLLKQVSIISAFVGAMLAFITFIPFVNFISFMALITCVSAFILIYMKRNYLIGIISLKEGCILGAVIGFVSFIAFSIIFTPVSMLLGSIISSYSLGFMRFFLSGFGSLIVMIFLIIFMGGISALFNAFTGLAVVYLTQLVTGETKEDNQNTSVDFEIK